MEQEIRFVLRIVTAAMAVPLWLAVRFAKSAWRLRNVGMLFRDAIACRACGTVVNLVGVFECPRCRLRSPGFYFSRCRLCGAVPSFIRCPNCGIGTLNPLGRDEGGR